MSPETRRLYHWIFHHKRAEAVMLMYFAWAFPDHAWLIDLHMRAKEGALPLDPMTKQKLRNLLGKEGWSGS